MNTLKSDLVVAVYDWHSVVERAVAALHDAGCNMKRISMVIRNDALWGRLYGLLLDSAPEFLRVHGHTLVLGNFAAARIHGAQNVIVLGDSTALTDAMSLLGFPMTCASRCEAALKTNDFILVAHGDERDANRVYELLETSGFVTLEHFRVGDAFEHSLPRNRTAGEDSPRERGFRQLAR
ncbi:MAG TPA: hypothetical protein VGO61_03710 [Steroidobacteraceae bacterium]|jgi:hypothetical protein|nr:hypothetical protein [Steroidobacteraceae bacterium]